MAAYLQATRGLIALPTRRSSSTIAYEYTMRDAITGQVYAVQVKTGDTEVPVHKLSAEGDLKWIIFSLDASTRPCCLPTSKRSGSTISSSSPKYSPMRFRP